ncbi:DsbC family protein [Pusillimonas sp. DMV24BSW_D]|uniref:DsbC family protein n=1 Tax=Neopusillimonas aestuarii TaxID=2716226 RepID=UPI00140DEDED|nr:DsbC family protein [Pusillimonas sp. DMV24BSW_D]QIM48619.1 DsbC family protein [Pusillimonas sp. DMV24BSW_D]
MLLNWVRKVLPAAVCGVLFAGASVAQSLEQQEYPPGQQVQETAPAEGSGQNTSNSLAASQQEALEPVVEPDLVKTRFENRFPGVEIVAVRRTPFNDLYEVQVGNDLVYSDAEVRFVMQGSLIDAVDRIDLTAKRLHSLNQVNFDELPLDKAIKQVTGDGSRVMVAFEDPNCGYCRRLHQTLTQIDNVTVYTLLFPILSPDSHEKARDIWCAEDRAAAWRQWMLNGVKPVQRECETPVAEITALARKLRITGTPALFFPDNTRINGAMPLENLRAKLESQDEAGSQSAQAQ